MVAEPDPLSPWTKLDRFRRPTSTSSTKFLEIVAGLIMLVLVLVTGTVYLLFELAGEPELDPLYHKIHEAMPDIEGPLHSDHGHEH